MHPLLYCRRFTEQTTWLQPPLGAITGASADYDVFARAGDLDLAILAVARFIGWVVANRVLRSELSRDLRKGVRQGGECISAQHTPARLAR